MTTTQNIVAAMVVWVFVVSPFCVWIGYRLGRRRRRGGTRWSA